MDCKIIIKSSIVLYSSEDIELLENFTWRIGKGDYVMRGTRVKGKYLNLYFHKFVAERMGLNIQGFLVDHINRNSLDNRRENLRLATFSLNNANSQKRSNNTTGYRGVYWIKQKQKWHSRIQVNNKLEFGLIWIQPAIKRTARQSYPTSWRN